MYQETEYKNIFHVTKVFERIIIHIYVLAVFAKLCLQKNIVKRCRFFAVDKKKKRPR